MENKRTYYQEAMRYIDNAKEQLKKSPKEGKYYADLKYVKSAGGIAYAGIEKSAKWLIALKGIKIEKDADVSEITKSLAKINKKALNIFNDLYFFLHKAVYYNGYNNVNKISDSLKDAALFIAFLKPYKEIAVYEKGGKAKSKIKASVKKPLSKINV